MSTFTHVSDRPVDIDALDQAIVNLAARINAATYELLVLIREFDERAGWLKWGFECCSQWLHWRCDLSRCAAREKVRVAHAMKELPEIAMAFSEGALSYSKVRALTRVATPVNESSLLSFALSTTAMRVEERCRQLRNTLPGAVAETNRVHERRSVRVWRDAQHGTVTLSVELPLESGELVCQALDKALETEGDHGAEFEQVSWSAQQADALVAMARSYLGGGAEGSSSTADAYQVVIHVDRAALEGEEGRSDVAVESVKRLVCDGSVVSMVDGTDGEPLNVGRKQRTVPAALKRALWSRDGGCCFPGCTHTRFVDAHHIRHWAEGGETSLGNTMLLCSSHHRLVHEGGYEIRRDYRGQWYFRRPDGRAIPRGGYQPEDMVDDDMGDEQNADTDSMNNGGASAEAPRRWRGFPIPTGVREAVVPYG